MSITSSGLYPSLRLAHSSEYVCSRLGLTSTTDLQAPTTYYAPIIDSLPKEKYILLSMYVY